MTFPDYLADRWGTTDYPDDLDTLLDNATTALDALPSLERKPIPRAEIEHVSASEIEIVSDYIEPWAQLPDESRHNMDMFQAYLDLGPNRTLAAVARQFGVTSTAITRPSSKFAWKDRARAFDAHLDRVYRAQLDQATRDMADRHASSMAQGLSVLAAPFVALQQRMDDDPEFITSLSNTSARRLLDLAFKAARVMPPMMGAERVARGLPNEIRRVEGTVEHEHIHHLDRDSLITIVAALESAGGLDDGGGTRQLGPPGEAADDTVDDGFSDAETDGVDAAEQHP